MGHAGCPELGAHRHMGSGKVSAQASAAAAATEPSYWQLLAAQYGSTGSHWRASSPHGPFLMSPSKAYQLAMHLARCTLLYYSCVEAVAEPSSPLAASLRSKGVPVEDIERHGLYGSKGLCARRLALLISLLLDCEARRHDLGLGCGAVCIGAPGWPLYTYCRWAVAVAHLRAAVHRAGTSWGWMRRQHGS